jgi:hypothetical protein
MLADIYHWFTEGFDTPDLKDAKTLLDHGPVRVCLGLIASALASRRNSAISRLSRGRNLSEIIACHLHDKIHYRG